MTLWFYDQGSPNNYVHKDLTPAVAGHMDGVLRGNSKVTDPVIEIQAPNLNTATLGNYVYISETKRFYFIQNIEFVHNTLWLLYLHVDVLFSHWDKIKYSHALCARSSSKYQMHLVDDKLAFSTVPTRVVYEFSENPFNTLLSADGQRFTMVIAGEGSGGE